MFGERYHELLADIFGANKLSEDFSLYLHAPSVTDEKMAPDGCVHPITCCRLCPILGVADIDWDKVGPIYRDRILNYLEERYVPGLSDDLVTVKHMTPFDFRDDLNAHLGSAFSIEPLADAKRLVPTAQPGRRRAQSLRGRRWDTSGCWYSWRCRVRKSHREFDVGRNSVTHDSLVHAAKASIRAGSKSFAAASRLLPRDVSDHTILLYAWCRHCDDVIDGQSGGGCMQEVPDVRERLRELAYRTEQALVGRPEGMPFEALSRVVRGKKIDPQFVFDHLAGYELDATAHRYFSIEDTLQYSYHVAGTVGAMMGQIMDVQSRDQLLHAVDLGIAFQLTNIARDVVEDAAAQRCYLPEFWLEDAGLSIENLAERNGLAEYKELAHRLLDHAEPFYLSARQGLSFLPEDCVLGILSALEIYHSIGEGVRRASSEDWAKRVSTSQWRKGKLILQSFFTVKTRRWVDISHTDRSALWTPETLRNYKPKEALLASA